MKNVTATASCWKIYPTTTCSLLGQCLWQTWHVDTPAHDLAYLMGVQWYSEHRHRQEEALLNRYQKGVAALGIQYGWDELVADYRLSVIRHLFTPVLFSGYMSPAIWWPQLDRVFCTFDDWNCVELLG